MIKYINLFVPFLFVLFIYSCSGDAKRPAGESETGVAVNDTTQMIQSFVCGLWSLDSQNILNNEGYFFKPDGTVDFVASEYQGNWEIVGTDSIKLKYSFFDSAYEQGFHIDSLSESRMVLSDTDGTHLFRKVPFGINAEETVISGYSGTLMPGLPKMYSFTIPSAKKLRIALSTTSENVKLKIYDSGGELTSTPVKDWQSIMVRSGEYKIVVDYLEPANAKMEDFSVKVFGN
jgi:hypothetical protein